MARYPGAIYKPITAPKNRMALKVYNRVNLHVAVSEASSLHGYFNKSWRADSHFYVRKDGTVEQYVDTSLRANADLNGNDATISIETQGGLRSAQTEKWTNAQVETLAQIYAWAVETHGVKLQIAKDAKIGNSSHGLSWHRLGINGSFPKAPSILAGRIQLGGGMLYSRDRGKVCPGDAKIKQVAAIFARAKEILNDVSVPAPILAKGGGVENWLQEGNVGPAVRDLQTLLNTHGAGLVVDGVFGPLTLAATRSFQTSAHLVIDGLAGPITLTALRAAQPPAPRPTALVVDGVFGPLTKRVLQRTLGVTADGRVGPVTKRALQTLLNTHGAALVVDGAWGPVTTRALQRRLGVIVDGSFGPVTKRALQARLNAGTL